METGDLTVFRCQDWLSKTLGDKKMVKELPAIVKGKAQIKGMSAALCTSGVGNLQPVGHVQPASNFYAANQASRRKK